MKFSLHSHNQQRGEVAWLLTVISMIVIGAGLVIGFNISTQEQTALRTSPFAQAEPTPTRAPSKKLLTEPRNSLPRVCFPFLKDASGNTARVSDPFCTARLIPLNFTNLAVSDKDFLGNMQATDLTKPQADRTNRVTSVNPFVRLTNPTADLTSIANPDETPSNPVSFTFNGGLCLLQNAVDNFDVTESTVYLSPFYVRKYEGTEGPSSASFDERDAIIVDANKIATGVNGENIQLTAGDATPRPTTKNQSICNYRSGAASAQTLSNTNRYPILFKINFELAELKRIIQKPDLKGHPDVQGFNKTDCSMYLHARGFDSAGDVWNIAKIHLKDIVGQEAADALCPATTPTPTATPTPSTPSVTPTTPSSTPAKLSCSQTCTTSAQCGTYADPEQGGSQQPLVCASVREFVDLCEKNPGGIGCTCVPEKCLGPSNLCTLQERSCGADPRISATPTPTPPVVTEAEPQELTCNYNALAFVEECLEIDPKTGACTQRGNRANAKAFTSTVLGTSDSPRPYAWGTTNNRQADNNLRLSAMIPATAFDVFTGDALFDIIERYRGFQMNTVDPLSAIDVSSSQQVPTTSKDPIQQIKELLRPRSDVKIEHLSELPENSELYTNEQYTNFSDAIVELEYDEEAYNILPNGKRVYKCTNELADRLAKLDPNDPQAVLARKACADETDAQKAELNRIYGLKVGCGQNIVYGWTLQKCTFDYDLVFVIDTSSTMALIDPTSPVQQTKLQRVQDEVKNFIDHARTQFGPKTRVGIISFNTATVPYDQANQSSDGGAGIQTPNMVSISDDAQVNSLKAMVDGLQAREGTCIQCGLRNAQTLLSRRSDPAERTPVVILLSDGLVNAYPNASATNPVLGVTDPNPGGSQEVLTVADELRADDATTSVTTGNRSYGGNSDTSDDVLLIALGYGETSIKEKQGQEFDNMIRMLASNRRDANRRISDTERWAYTTDRDVSPEAVDFAAIVGRVKTDLNSCTRVGLAYENFQKAKDVNGDGIINVIDLFTVFDNYFAKGENLKEDINADGVVNVNDVTLIIESLGTVITPADADASGSANAAPINEEFQSGLTGSN